MDLFPNEQNFDLDKSRQKFHHSFKEHYKINNIPMFRCEMLQNADNIALRILPFTSQGYITAFYNISQRNFGILLIL